MQIFILAVAFLACVPVIYIFWTFCASEWGKYPPYLPSFGKMKKIALAEARHVLAEKRARVNVIDLGCGGGGLLRKLGKEFPSHMFTGIEWSFIPFLIAKIKTARLPNVIIVRQNFMTFNCGRQNLVMIFGSHQIADELGKKLAHELPKDAIIISEAFSIAGLKQKSHIKARSLFFIKTDVFVYETPQRKSQKEHTNRP